MVDRAAAMMVGALCVLGPGVARADDTVPEELLRRPIEASVELRGLAGAPGYGFYLFPVYCTTPLAALDGPAPLISAFMEDEQLGRPNYAELRDGPLAAWIPEGEVCRPSKLYALPRAVAAEVDLPAMSLEALARFFAEDRRVLRGALRLLDDPPEVPPHSRLRAVHEVVRVLGVEAGAGIEVVVDAATYRFTDGSEQTLKLGHTRRPALPFAPLGAAKVEAYAAAYARWDAKHPPEPVVAEVADVKADVKVDVKAADGPVQGSTAVLAEERVAEGAEVAEGEDGQTGGRGWLLAIVGGVGLVGALGLVRWRRG